MNRLRTSMMQKRLGRTAVGPSRLQIAPAGYTPSLAFDQKNRPVRHVLDPVWRLPTSGPLSACSGVAILRRKPGLFLLNRPANLFDCDPMLLHLFDDLPHHRASFFLECGRELAFELLPLSKEFFQV